MAKLSESEKINKWVFWPFLVLVFSVFFTPFVLFPPLLFPYITSKAFLFRIIIELALPFYVYLVIRYPAFRPNWKNPLTIFILFFLMANLAASFAGVNASRSLWGNFERMGGTYYLAHLSLWYFYILLIARAGENYLKRFLQGFVVTGLLLTLNGFFGKLGWFKLLKDPSLPERVSSTFGNPIFFASFLVLPLGLCLYFFLQAQTRALKIYYAAGSLFLLWGIYASGTRGSLVGLAAAAAAGVLLYGVMGGHSKARRFAVSAGVVLLAAAAAVALFAGRFPQSGARRILSFNDSNSKARLIQWKTAWTGYLQHPVFGVGPENYYVVANKLQPSTLAEYDASWFDKPHNYYLEILSTTGTFGFLGYAGILAAVMFGFYTAYRREVIGLVEFLVLSGGFAAYLVQNLFVFDTVSASVAFFIICGLAGYFLEGSPAAQTKNAPRSLAAIFAAAGVLLSAYLIYVTNILPILASRAVNYGFAYSQRQQEIGARYFSQAISNPANFDLPATANRYSEFVDELIQSSLVDDNPQFVLEQIKKSDDFQKDVAEKIKNDPILWIRLAQDDMLADLVTGKTLDGNIEDEIKKAAELAPNRAEPLQVYLRLYGFKKDWPKAVAVAEKIASMQPYNQTMQMQLASALNQDGQRERAAAVANMALAAGYRPQKAAEILWLAEYYGSIADWQKAARLYQQSSDLEPEDLGIYLNLIKAYLQAGEKDKAKILLQLLVDKNPQAKAQLQPLIDQANK